MPEFDTYNTIERFARDNRNPAAMQAFLFLRKRAELMMRWRVLNAESYDFSEAAQAYLGLNKALTTVAKGLGDMEEEERQRLYEEACSEVGIQLDPKTFTRSTSE